MHLLDSKHFFSVYHLLGGALMFGKEFEPWLCMNKDYIVYTDIAKHQEWIEKQILNDMYNSRIQIFLVYFHSICNMYIIILLSEYLN